MAKYIIELTDTEEKALLTDVVSIQEWIDNAIHSKANQCIDKIITEISDKQPTKIPTQEKETLIKNATLETAQERTKRLLPKEPLGGYAIK